MSIRSDLELRRIVKKKIKEPILDSMLTYPSDAPVGLQGNEQPDNYLERMMLLTLYKDTEGIGYDALEERCRGQLRAPHETVRTNARRLRHFLADWAEDHIVLGNKAAWERASERVPYKIDGYGKALLWVDTFDARQPGRFTASKKSPDWSYKCKAPGRRWLTFRDGKRRFVKVMGPHYPKTTDAEIIVTARRELCEDLRGATLVGDCAYYDVRDQLPGVQIMAPTPEPRGRAPAGLPKDARKLGDAALKLNLRIRKLRARVEHDYSDIQHRFQSLAKIWSETDTQLDHVVRIACAVHNLSVK